jgi:hypothetical protein
MHCKEEQTVTVAGLCPGAWLGRTCTSLPGHSLVQGGLMAGVNKAGKKRMHQLIRAGLRYEGHKGCCAVWS